MRCDVCGAMLSQPASPAACYRSQAASPAGVLRTPASRRLLRSQAASRFPQTRGICGPSPAKCREVPSTDAPSNKRKETAQARVTVK